MFDPFDEDERSQEPPRPPFPTPMGALLLTFGASLASLAVAVLFFGRLDLLSRGVGEALGVGLVATFAARRVPDPQPERLGLQGFSPALIPALICIVPIVFLTSELDNVGRSIDAMLPPIGLEEALVDDPTAATEEAGETGADAGGDADPVAAEAPAEADGGETSSASDDALADRSAVERAGDQGEARPDLDAVGDATASPTDGPGSLDAPEIDPSAPILTDSQELDPSAPTLADSQELDPNAPILPDPPEGWVLMQLAIVMVGISPVVQGFLLFGVILQGVVTWLGRTRGLVLTGCLYSLTHAFSQAGADPGVFQTIAAIVSFIGIGVVLGVARLATGSVIAPILLETAFKGVALFAMTSPDVFAVRGYNVGPDQHTSIAVLLPSLAAVIWGLRAMTRRGRGAW